MKTQEELKALREEFEIVSRKLYELTNEELVQVIGAGCCESQECANSILVDSDMAEEATRLAQAQIMQQASQGMVAQNNQRIADVLGLLQ
ncbi:MAG: hypothetical protein KBT19_02465 [Lachnospiraceae bacterium]|nr:hypothetical protein [Candidatus Colinaster equi]